MNFSRTTRISLDGLDHSEISGSDFMYVQLLSVLHEYVKKVFIQQNLAADGFI